MTVRRKPRSMFRVTAFALAAAILAIAVHRLSSPSLERRELLAEAKSWTYQLQGLGGALPELAASASDLLVIDYAKTGGKGTSPLSADEVAALKRKPDGSRRLVVAYLSIGEAEEYRPYWQASWKTDPPAWLAEKNCRWPDNHLVRFWHDDWENLVYRAPGSYLARIQAAGFDGVYLDRIDVYAEVSHPDGAGKAAMVSFVRQLAATARRSVPGFLVIAQNAEELLEDASYRGIIDGIAKEDLLYGLTGTGVRNGADEIKWSSRQLKRLHRDGKAVLVVEYLKSQAAIDAARQELAGLGFVPAFPPRSLDGSDPLALVAKTSGDGDSNDSDQGGERDRGGDAEKGTPEYARSNCETAVKKDAP